MKNLKIVIGVLFVVAIGAYFFPQGQNFVAGLASSAAGSTFNSAKVATIIWQPSVAGATSTSILNTDPNDRTIQSTSYFCTGLGVVFNGGTVLPSGGLIFRGATTSANTNIISTLGNANFILVNSVATSTSADYVGSTTPGRVDVNVQNRIWASGSYLTFTASATSTATCNIGVNYLTN